MENIKWYNLNKVGSMTGSEDKILLLERKQVYLDKYKPSPPSGPWPGTGPARKG
jgi:hypothetical protein